MKNKKLQDKERKLKKRSLKRNGPSTSDIVSWADVEATQLANLVAEVTENGGSIMFLRTRDGGTLGMRIYHDELEPETLYGRPTDSTIDEHLASIAAWLRDRAAGG